MKVLVDTSVWSLALRRKEKNVITNKLTELIGSSMIVMIGPVRQEILSGLSDRLIFDRLKSSLQSYDDLPITVRDYETAAEYYNTCRKNGIQGSHIDFLICSVACNNNLVIFTTDQDFQHYAKYLPIRLLKPDTEQ